MTTKPHAINSMAYEWVREKALCTRNGQFDDSIRQEDGTYVPELACDDLLADQVALYASNEATGMVVAAVRFPDNSVVWWTDDVWSIADGDGMDVSEQWQLTEL